MRKFVFTLDRVLGLRQAQARVEEMKLERLYAEHHAIEAREHAWRDGLRQSQSELYLRGNVPAGELAALDNFQQHVQTEVRRSQQARAACQRRIEAQLLVVVAKRRDVKLFEKLKLQRQQSWKLELDREIAQQAEETHLAKWNRENIQ